MPEKQLRRHDSAMIGAEEDAVIPYWIPIGTKGIKIRLGYHVSMHRHMQPYRRNRGPMTNFMD